MKKSMLNVITLALVLVNLILTVLLTFSLVSTNKKTNSLITKVAQIIDLDAGGGLTNNTSGSGSTGIENIKYVDVKNNDSTDIIVSFVDNNGKTRYAVLTVSLGLNSKAIRIIVRIDFNRLSANKTAIETNLLKEMQELFKTETIQSVLVNMVIQ